MVREQLVERGITSPAVLAAMQKIPRHLFVQEALQAQAYEDHPLPIGHGQTISQPYVVALMSQIIRAEPGMRVLEIGTGSGYQAVILAEMGLEVYTIERIPELQSHARMLFRKLGYTAVYSRVADGTTGWPQAAPFDRILVTAGGPGIPEPLAEQLADPGLLAIPVGPSRQGQELFLMQKYDGVLAYKNYGKVTFVDLVGSHGW